MSAQLEYRTRLRSRGQVTVPKELRSALDLQEGDAITFRLQENGRLVIEKEITVSADQTWFWSERWQDLEREAQADIEAGRVTHYSDVDEAIESLRSLENDVGTGVHKDV
jgi:AbrB family looped-hinge helix DNA binding protein